MKEKLKSIFEKSGKFSGVAALLMAGILAALLCDGLIQLSKDYRTVSSKDYSVITEETIINSTYYDHVYFAHIYKKTLTPENPNPVADVQNYIADIPDVFSPDVFNGIVMYAAVICTVAALFVYERSKTDPKKHLILMVLTPVVIVGLIAGLSWSVAALCGLRLPFPSDTGSDCFFIGLCSLIAGCCAIGLLLRKIPLKKIAALLLIPVVIFLMIKINDMELDFFTSENSASAVTTDAALSTAENTDEDEGKAGMIVFLAAFPFSGCDLWSVFDEGAEIPKWTVWLIMGKNAFWFGLATVLLLRKRSDEYRSRVPA